MTGLSKMKQERFLEQLLGILEGIELNLKRLVEQGIPLEITGIPRIEIKEIE